MGNQTEIKRDFRPTVEINLGVADHLLSQEVNPYYWKREWFDREETEKRFPRVFSGDLSKGETHIGDIWVDSNTKVQYVYTKSYADHAAEPGMWVKLHGPLT